MTTEPSRAPNFDWVILLAPLIFIGHWLEEAPGFVAWFNAHVPRGIDQGLFSTVNSVALTITVTVVALEWFSKSDVSAAAVVAWFSLLFGANALLHIVGAMYDRAYVPGLWTAILLYVPFYVWLMLRIVRERRLPPIAVSALAILGAIPMCLHGYLIIFRQSRLF